MKGNFVGHQRRTAALKLSLIPARSAGRRRVRRWPVGRVRCLRASGSATAAAGSRVVGSRWSGGARREEEA